MSETFPISTRTLLTLAGQLAGYPNPDDPAPPGPWGPVIRRALERVRLALLAGPSPDPWRVAGPQPDPWRAVLMTSLAEEAIDRALLMQEVVDVMPRSAETHGIIIVGGYISRFVDEICGNGFRLRIPVPHPRPHWLSEELTGSDLLLFALPFQRAAAGNEAVRAELQRAGTRLAEAGAQRA